MPGALLTDLYELKMAASYLRHEMAGRATFSLFVRDLPPERGFLVAAGLADCLAWLEQFSFETEELDYLETVGFDRPILEAFGGLRFTGDVWAVPEGRVVFANEPLLEVSAPIAEAQLVETYLLNQVTLQTMLASKAARCRIAADGRIDVVEFGFRRSQGLEAGIAAARTSALVGFSGTSNVEAARRFALEPSGTMAHSYIESFESELEAFSIFAGGFPDQPTFLVDTFDTLAGVARAIEVIHDHRLQDRAGIRLDSGDLVVLATEARRMLDEAGLRAVRIFVSGGLDEHDLARFVALGAPIDAVGLGTRLGVSADAPYLDSVYKLVAYDGRPVSKLSTDKATLPGAKQVHRAEGLHDTIARREEPTPEGSVALLGEVMRSGRRTVAPEPLVVARSRFESDLRQLLGPARRLRGPVAPIVGVSSQLRELTAVVRAEALER